MLCPNWGFRALGKLALQGNRQGTGMPTNTTTELVTVLEKVAKQSNPGAITSVKVMRAAYDFSGIVQHVTPFTGSSDHRLMALYKDSSSKGVIGQLCRDLASKLPAALILEKGGVADSFEVLHADAVEACSGNFPMAAHDEAGIEKARIGIATTLRVLKAPGRHGLRLPAAAFGTPPADYFKAKIAEVERDMWVPGSPDEEPPGGFDPAPLFPVGLMSQPPNAVSTFVTGASALTAALPIENPYVGRGNRPVREAHVDSADLPANHGGMPAIIACYDKVPPYVALAMITGVATSNDDPEQSLYRCRWYDAPSETVNGTGVAVFQQQDDNWVGAPEYRLVTADSALNHATSQSKGNWKTRKGVIKMPKTAMAKWKTAKQEMALRNNPGRAAEPAELMSEAASRAVASRRRKGKRPRTGPGPSSEDSDG